MRGIPYLLYILGGLIGMRAFGYVRRSSSERKTNYSVESQKKVITDLATHFGDIIKDGDIYVDEGYSGTTLKRPNVQKMLREIATCKEDEIHLYIWLSSRLSRNLMYTNSLRYVFEKYNVKVISQNEDWVSLEEMRNTPDSSLKPNIIGAADEAEIARDRYRTKVGLKTSAERGNYAKGGTVPPTGYKFISEKGVKGRTIEIDENYVEVMLYILKEIHDHQRTIESIALELDSRKACGVKWSYSKVYKAVTNKIIYGCFESSYVSLENHSPAYIEKEYYDECMRILNSRRKEVNHKYLFKKKIKCCQCDVLCSEIPTIHYPRNVSTKKPKRANKKKVYKYYFCPICKKRINEDKNVEKYDCRYK